MDTYKDNILNHSKPLLHRDTSAPIHVSTKLTGIEAARGMAALLVVLYHAARHIKANFGFMPLHGAPQFGHAGVDFFFVLSGFIIMFVHRKDFGQPSQLGVYFQRRFTRIYPFFWFSLLVGGLLTAVSHADQLPSPISALHAMSLLPNRDDLGVAWTLQYEILFYLIFAIAIANVRAGALVLAAWTGLVFCAWVFPSAMGSNLLLQRLSSPFNIEFFFGMLAAYLAAQRPSLNANALLAVGLLLFFGVGLAEVLNLLDGYAPPARIAYGLGAMIIVVALALPDADRQIAVPAFLVRLGSASYSIYLMHLPCIGIIYKLLAITGLVSMLPVWLLFILLSIAGVFGGMVISRVIEVPLINGVRRLLKSRSACTAPVPMQTKP